MKLHKTTVVLLIAFLKATSCLMPFKEDLQDFKLSKSDIFFLRRGEQESNINDKQIHPIQNDFKDLYEHKQHRKVDLKSHRIYNLNLIKDSNPAPFSLTLNSNSQSSKVSNRMDFEEPYGVMRNRIIPVKLHQVKYPVKRHASLFDAPSPIYDKSPPKAVAVPVHKVLHQPPVDKSKPIALPAQLKTTTPKTVVQTTHMTTEAIIMDNSLKLLAFPVNKLKSRALGGNLDYLFVPSKLVAIPTEYVLPDVMKKKLLKYFKPVFLKNAPKMLPVPIYKMLSMPKTKRKRPVAIYRTVYLHMPVKRVRAAEAMSINDNQLSPTTDAVVKMKPLQPKKDYFNRLQLPTKMNFFSKQKMQSKRDYLSKSPIQIKQDYLSKLQLQVRSTSASKLQPCRCKTNMNSTIDKPLASHAKAEQVFYSGGKCYRVNGTNYNDIDC